MHINVTRTLGAKLENNAYNLQIKKNGNMIKSTKVG